MMTGWFQEAFRRRIRCIVFTHSHLRNQPWLRFRETTHSALLLVSSTLFQGFFAKTGRWTMRALLLLREIFAKNNGPFGRGSCIQGIVARESIAFAGIDALHHGSARDLRFGAHSLRLPRIVPSHVKLWNKRKKQQGHCYYKHNADFNKIGSLWIVCNNDQDRQSGQEDLNHTGDRDSNVFPCKIRHEHNGGQEE